MKKSKKEMVLYPLSEAVIYNDIESFEKLMATGVNVDGLDYNNIPPLFYAAIYGRLEMARQLLNRGANIHCKDEYGNTPLHEAVFRDNECCVDLINLLISFGADINAANNYGVTPKGLSKIIAGFPDIEAFKD